MTELDLLREAFVSVGDAEPRTIAQARRRLLEAIDSPTGGRPRRARPRRLTVAVIVVLAVVVASAVSLHGRLSAVSPAAAAARACGDSGAARNCLDALARVAAHGSLPVGVIRVTSDELMGPADVTPWKLPGVRRAFTVFAVNVRGVSIDAATGRTVVRTRPRGLWFPTVADRRAWIGAGSPSWPSMFGRQPARTTTRVLASPDSLYFYSLAAWQRATRSANPGAVLPTNPGRMLALLEQVNRLLGQPGPVGALATLPLRDPLLQPAQRAALFAALAETQGARRATLRDPRGRSGPAIIGPSGYGQLRWITLFDTRTSRVLAEGVQGADFGGSHTPPPHRVWLELYPAAPQSATQP
jgi:hypothetical protein